MLNPVLLEMATLYSGDPFDFLMEDDGPELMHYGVGPDDNPPGRGSGRYEKGSGEEPYQHGIGSFLERVDYYKKNGVTNQKELAQLCGCKNTTDFRLEYTKALHGWKQERASKAQAMIASGKSKKAVADHFGIRESTLSSWLNPKSLERVSAAQRTADFLEDQVKQKGMIEVGAGVEKEIGASIAKELGVSRTKFSEALSLLEAKGYNVFGGRVPQATNPGKKTTITVLAGPDAKWSDIYNHPEKIQSVADYVCRENDKGEDVYEKKWEYPASMDSSRLMIRYADDIAPDGHTGLEKDGTIEIRRNVPDLSLEGSHYAQVRIMVDNSKYLKGMALYSDHMPDGVDVVFNTNKTRDQADIVLKNIKKDPDNPFGALLRNEGGQYKYTDENGERKLGLINKTRQEGDWEDWKDSLPSQFLAKQPMELINRQLGKAIEEKKSELAGIMALTNPTLKKSLLDDFAEGCDHDAVHMSAAALPRQKYQVILPIPTLKDNEVYAPNFKDGETIALVRFPHAGLFEIPILTVNNRNPQGQEMMGKNPVDAIGLNKTNADRLSGADFDGDTVMCIPCNNPHDKNNIWIQNQPPLTELEGFDPKEKYGYDHIESRMEKVKKKDGTYEEQEVEHYFRNGQEFKPMTRTGLEMGNVSNLIMDMTLKGATPSELAMAAKHSMVVIDAEKHHLDWKKSEIDNHIRELKKKYQERIDDEDGSLHYGASTLITRAKSPTQIVKPTGSPHIDPETGRLYYTDKQLTPQTYIDKDGKTKVRMEDVNLLDTKKSAFELVSTYDPKHPDRTFILSPKEAAYAQYSDMLRAMANDARKEIVASGDIKYNREAEKQYHEEAEHLISELMLAELNAPRERMAQLYARGVVLAKRRDNPDMTKKEIKKASQQALANGRLKFGATRHQIDITPKEWEAIQSGAISATRLKGILQYANADQVRAYATPRQGVELTSAQKSRLKAQLSNPRNSIESIANAMNISISTIHKYQKELGVI